MKQTDYTAVLKATLALIQTKLTAGHEVNFLNFGSFSAKATATRAGCNLQTGETFTILAGKKVKFNPGKALKAAVN